MSFDENSFIEALDTPCRRSDVDKGLGARGTGIGMLQCLRGEPSVQSLCIGLGQVGVYPWGFQPGVKEGRPFVIYGHSVWIFSN